MKSIKSSIDTSGADYLYSLRTKSTSNNNLKSQPDINMIMSKARNPLKAFLNRSNSIKIQKANIRGGVSFIQGACGKIFINSKNIARSL